MYVSGMYLVLCYVSGKTDLVTPINSVLFCTVLILKSKISLICGNKYRTI